MNTSKATEILEELKKTTSHHDFNAIAIDHQVPAYIAIDQMGLFSLLVEANSNRQAQNMTTDLVALRLAANCTLNLSEGIQQKKLHVLQCLSQNEDLIHTFITLSLALCQQFSSKRSVEDVLETFFTSLVQLFQTTPQPNTSEARQGLWGELFLIRHLRNTVDMVNYWHSDPTRTFDFSSHLRRLEVKTTTSPERIHHVSHQQLYEQGNDEIVIASLLLLHDDTGLTLRELIDELRVVMKGNYQRLLKLEKAIRRAGMGQFLDSGPCFSETHATNNLAWYQVGVVPRFPQAEPPGVSGTRYKVDLSTVPRFSEYSVREWLSTW